VSLEREDDILLNVYRAVVKAREMENGDERVAVVEEAVRLADAGADLKLRYFARQELLEAAFWGGSPEKSLVAFSWLLAQHDRHPELFEESWLLWTYKWIVNTICNFPQVSKEKIYEMLDDMARRYVAAGRGLRVVEQHRYRAERFWGNREEAVRIYRRAELLPSDDLSNCPACEVDERVSFHVYLDDFARGLEEARPILEGGLKCRTVPHRTLARFLVPLLRMDRREEAREFHLRGYPLVEGDKGLLAYACDHLAYLALAGEDERAADALAAHYHFAERTADMHNRYLFYRAAWLFADIKAGDPAGARLRLRMPSTFPAFDPSGLYDARRLADWFRREAARLAARFDARNGNDYFSRKLGETMSLKELRKDV
jgi:hypothetical protein